MNEFFKTLMGRQFYEGTMPKLVSVLERIAKALEEDFKSRQNMTTDRPAQDPFFITSVEALCPYCREQALVPGAIFPIMSGGRGDHAYVERCDECQLFVDDMAAAVGVAAFLAREVSGVDAHPYVIGLTMEAAESLRAARRDV